MRVLHMFVMVQILGLPGVGSQTWSSTSWRVLDNNKDSEEKHGNQGSPKCLSVLAHACLAKVSVLVPSSAKAPTCVLNGLARGTGNQKGLYSPLTYWAVSASQKWASSPKGGSSKQ